MERVAVVGAGTMGTALASVASATRRCVLWCADAETAFEINSRRRHPHYFHDRTLPPSLAATNDLRVAVQHAGCVVVALPSEQMRTSVRALRPLLADDAVLVSATKGLEADTHKRMSELLEEETGTTRVAAISGPNLSYDIVAARPTVLMIAARSGDVAERVGCVLTGPAVRTQVSTDLVGVELAGSLKNVVAIAAGIAAGLDLGDNARAAIVAAGLCEIQRLGVRLGARAETFTGLAGIGDLFLTATSESSRNHMVGVEIGRGACLDDVVVRLGRMRETAEGIHTVRACHALAHTHRVVLPLADAVYRVLFEDADPRTHLVGALSGV